MPLDFRKMAKTARSVAENMPTTRLETRETMQSIAQFLESLVEGPDPKAAPNLVTEASKEASGDATAGPGPSHKWIVPVTLYDPKCTVSAEAFKDLKRPAVKMACDPEENDRVSMAESTGVQVILHMEEDT